VRQETITIVRAEAAPAPVLAAGINLRGVEAMRSQMIGGRDWIAFGAGAILMMVASRIAPPAAGRAIGTIRAMTGGDPFDALAQDHRKVLALIDAMEQSPDSARARRAAMLFQLKRMLTAHALAEEDIIYPMLRDDAERKEMATHLYREHADMKVRLFELEHRAKDDPGWMACLRELRSMIAAHAKQEEEHEFPRLRAAIGKQSTSQLMGEVQREKSLVL
jgi:hemerythrin superfamily protein